MTLEPQSGRATGRAGFLDQALPAGPAWTAAVPLPTSRQAGRQATDGLWLLQLERPTLITPTRPTPPSLRERENGKSPSGVG